MTSISISRALVLVCWSHSQWILSIKENVQLTKHQTESLLFITVKLYTYINPHSNQLETSKFRLLVLCTFAVLLTIPVADVMNFLLINNFSAHAEVRCKVEMMREFKENKSYFYGMHLTFLTLLCIALYQWFFFRFWSCSLFKNVFLFSKLLEWAKSVTIDK